MNALRAGPLAAWLRHNAAHSLCVRSHNGVTMRTFAIIVIFFVSGCATSGYQKFYKSYSDPKLDPNIASLEEGQTPKVFGTKDFKRDIRLLKAKRYIVVGESSFNGGYEDIRNAEKQAKLLGATLVLTNSEYTNTQSSTSTLFIPNTQTTYHSGSVYSGSSTGTYNGTSTTYGSTAVPYTTHQRRFDQTAVYLAKLTKKLKFGVEVRDLSPEQRLAIERNTGALIDIVMENEPAFNSNIMAGDILVSIDGQKVINGSNAVQLMGSIPNGQPSSSLTIIRNGKERVITVEF